MKNILEDLYYGDIAPGLEKPTPAYEEIRDRMTEQEQEVIKLLGKEHKGQFTDYQETEDERLCLEQLTSFSQGFRLGARLMLTIFDESNR